MNFHGLLQDTFNLYPLSSKKRPHFKICKILRRIKIWSWVTTGTESKSDVLASARSNLPSRFESITITAIAMATAETTGGLVTPITM
jgi:hypothetical protein